MYELSEMKYSIAANNVQTVCFLSENKQKLPTKSARTFVQTTSDPSSCIESANNHIENITIKAEREARISLV